jgi:hypothetical protein
MEGFRSKCEMSDGRWRWTAYGCYHRSCGGSGPPEHVRVTASPPPPRGAVRAVRPKHPARGLELSQPARNRNRKLKFNLPENASQVSPLKRSIAARCAPPPPPPFPGALEWARRPSALYWRWARFYICHTGQLCVSRTG